MARIILGVTGSAAAREAIPLAEKLTRNGYLVDVVLTEAATHFVDADQLKAATGRPVHTSLYENGAQGEGTHVALAREADMAVIAPATANTIAKIAAGFGDNLLTATIQAMGDMPVLVCPAMMPAVYRGQQTQENRRTLENLGYVFLGPVDAGSGKGALASTDAIAEKITDMLNPELWGAYI